MSGKKRTVKIYSFLRKYQWVDALIFKKYSELIYRLSGINLSPEKNALLETRIARRMRALGIEDNRSYLNYVIDKKNRAETINLIDAVSTNVTSFFREADHFQYLADAFSRQIAKGRKKFRYWTAACSSGEEPYTLAMVLLERACGAPVDLKILATDISTEILGKCQAGIYSERNIEPIPRELLNKYFSRVKVGDGRSYRVNQNIRSRVVFKRLNLSTPPFPMSGPLDAVLCRNVMIYFDNAVRQKLLDDIVRLLKPGGHLIVGHTESLSGVKLNVKTIMPSVYRKLA